MTNPIKNAINLRGGFPSGKGANQRLGAFILACVGFLHSCCLHFDVFLITHRHDCIFWVKAARQLPLFIDLFIFIYLFRMKIGSTVCVLAVARVTAAGVPGMWLLMERKTLKRRRNDSF